MTETLRADFASRVARDLPPVKVAEALLGWTCIVAWVLMLMVFL